MLNPIEAYKEAGRMCAIARNERDEARAQFHSIWFHQARSLENGDARVQAEKAYREAYTAARRI